MSIMECCKLTGSTPLRADRAQAWCLRDLPCQSRLPSCGQLAGLAAATLALLPYAVGADHGIRVLRLRAAHDTWGEDTLRATGQMLPLALAASGTCTTLTAYGVHTA